MLKVKKNYLLEFLSVFIAVISAFALNSWYDSKKDSLSEEKILKEIRSGLQLDLKDIAINKREHVNATKYLYYFRSLLNNEPISQDSIGFKYRHALTEFSILVNKSGYESLKNKGLELIKNDSLRSKIINLYEYDFELMVKLEEKFDELQPFKNYFMPINNILYPYFEFDERGILKEIKQPIEISKLEKKKIFSYLWRIEENKRIKYYYYDGVEKKVHNLIAVIDKELEKF